MKKRKVTRQQRKRFCQAFEEAMTTLGITDWDVDVLIEKGRHVEVTADKKQHRAWVYLPKRWPGKMSKALIRHVAVHECVHVLLNPLTLVAKDRERFISETELNEAIESVTVRITGAVERLIAAEHQ